MIAVVDYGAGNLRSVCNALETLRVEHEIATQAAQLEQASGILLPGVGHFGQMMAALIELGLVDSLKNEKPLLGICLGMQALFESSDEAPGVAGLGVIPGRVERFPNTVRAPHMGWNDVKSGPETQTVYFANSYYAPVGPWTRGISGYEVPFSAIVQKGTATGFQFHPEKSGPEGLKLLKEWADSC